MSATVHDTSASRSAPSIPVQIARASAGTFAALLVISLVVALVASRDSLLVLWYRVVGDPTISLAEGVTLPDRPADVVVPELSAAPWAPASDISRIQAVTGSPVRAVTAAEASALIGTTMLDDSGRPAVRRYATPLGVVAIDDSAYAAASTDSVPQLSLWPTASTPATPTEVQQIDLLRRLVTGWGIGATPAVTGTHVLVERSSMIGAPAGFIDARAATDGAVTGPGSAGVAFFGTTSGRLIRAEVMLSRVTSTPTVHVRSAAEAFSAVRHHADGSVTEQGSVTGSRLVVGDYFGHDAATTQMWTFSRADGGELAEAVAVG